MWRRYQSSFASYDEGAPMEEPKPKVKRPYTGSQKGRNWTKQCITCGEVRPCRGDMCYPCHTALKTAIEGPPKKRGPDKKKRTRKRRHMERELHFVAGCDVIIHPNERIIRVEDRDVTVAVRKAFSPVSLAMAIEKDEDRRYWEELIEALRERLCKQ